MHERLLRRRIGERDLSGEHGEGDEAQRVDVGADVEWLAGELLGTHVFRGPDRHPHGRDGLPTSPGRLGDSEVHQLHELPAVGIPRDENVVRLEVAVDDSALVRRGEGVRDLTRQLTGIRQRQRASATDEGGERFTLDVLHREVKRAVGRLPEIVDGGDVGMVDLARVRGLPVEPADGIGGWRERGAHHLHSAQPPHAHVLGEIHAAHASLAQRPDDTIAVGEQRSDEQVCWSLGLVEASTVVRTHLHL